MVFSANCLQGQLTFCQIVFLAFCLLGRKAHAPIFKETEIQFEAQSQFEQKKKLRNLLTLFAEIKNLKEVKMSSSILWSDLIKYKM